MKMLMAIWVLTLKDLRVYFRDRTGVALGFGLPVVLVLGFGFIYKMTFGSQGGLTQSTVWVGDEDDTAASRAFVASLRSSAMLSVRPVEGDAPLTDEELRDKVESGEAHHALVIRAGFEAAMAEPRFPDLRMYRDPGRTLEAQMVSLGLMQAFFSAGGTQLSSLFTARALDAAGLPSEWSDRMLEVSDVFSRSVTALFSQAADEGVLDGDTAEDSAPEGDEADGEGAGLDFTAVMSDLVPVERIDLQPPERPKQLTYMLAHTVAGMSVMMLMFGLVACGMLLLQERDEGTMKRLFLSSMPRSAILGGKFLFTAIVGALQLVLIYIVGGLFFQVNLMRDPLTLIVVSLGLVFSVTAFGILIAAAAKTQKQAEGMSTLIILMMSAIGGAWFPVQMFALPPIGEVVCRCSLTWWAMSAFQGMLWHGKSFTDPGMLRDLGVLVAFGVVATLLAIRVFRSRFIED